MTLVSGIVTYVVIWWLVMFCVLPVGIRREEAPAPGHDTGAPANAHIGRKILATTLIATVLFGIAAYVIESGAISFRGS